MTTNQLISRMLSGVMSLLGFSSCSALGEEPECMYGTPVADYEIKGKVTDDKGAPVQDAQVVLELHKFKDSEGKDLIIGDTVYTKSDGEYKIELKRACISHDRTMICNSPIPELDNDTLEIHLNNPTGSNKGDAWYQGKSVTNVDFKLPAKKPANKD